MRTTRLYGWITLAILLFSADSTIFNADLAAQSHDCPILKEDGSTAAEDDIIETGANGTTELDLGGAGRMIIGPRSKVLVDVSYCPAATGGAMSMKLHEGTLCVKGTSTDRKIEVTTENFIVMVGTSTLTINASTLDTTFTMVQGTQEISTRDWKDTVETGSMTVPFAGPVSTIFALEGRPVVMPWGTRGAILNAGLQATHGFTTEIMSSDPKEIDQTEVVFAMDGGYRGS